MPYNDFSFLTDSEDEKTVDDIISQATDHLVLEQIAKLNSSSFDDTLLPSNLETRFRKLKSLPTETTRAANSASRAVNPLIKSKSFTPPESVDEEKRGNKGVKKSKDENLLSKVLESKVRKLKELETKVKNRRSKTSFSESDSEKSDDSDKTKSSSRSEWDLDSETDKKKSSKHKKNLKTQSVSDMWRKIGCLFCSPKKGQGKNQGNYDEDGDDYMKSFSAKERKKLMKKAMKEEEKLNKEADKIVKWAKQASDRMMNVSGLNLDEEDLTDFHN